MRWSFNGKWSTGVRRTQKWITQSCCISLYDDRQGAILWTPTTVKHESSLFWSTRSQRKTYIPSATGWEHLPRKNKISSNLHEAPWHSTHRPAHMTISVYSIFYNSKGSRTPETVLENVNEIKETRIPPYPPYQFWIWHHASCSY